MRLQPMEKLRDSVLDADPGRPAEHPRDLAGVRDVDLLVAGSPRLVLHIERGAEQPVDEWREFAPD